MYIKSTDRETALSDILQTIGTDDRLNHETTNHYSVDLSVYTVYMHMIIIIFSGDINVY